jgi:undecaprenyl diphosphate synthase
MADLKSPAFKSIPTHIAVIMDGNGRWAKAKGLPRVEGHKKGADSLREAIKTCMELGVKYLTVYAFSTENWDRPKTEVNFLMSLLSYTLDNELKELHKNNIRVRFLGRLSMLPDNLQKKIVSAHALTENNKALNLNIMLSYGGRAEIIDSIKTIIEKNIPPEKIDETVVADHLYSAGMPDPDLLIRTAGEMRVSNFMLWQIAYSELYVTKTLWPDFRKTDLLDAVASYNERHRKFGGL